MKNASDILSRVEELKDQLRDLRQQLRHANETPRKQQIEACIANLNDILDVYSQLRRLFVTVDRIDPDGL